MPEANDIALLAEYAKTGSEPAFAALVGRHIHLVHSVALRHIINPSHAEEITQAVFIVLARKAKSLGRKTVLSGWLYQTARLTAANYLRADLRRQRREQEAYMESLLNEPTPEIWRQIAPLLDDAMGRLGETDRNVIVLRFFENKSAREIAEALAIDPGTAQKRVTRAVDRLRKIFLDRGVTHSASALTETVSTNAVQMAPVALAKSVTAVAIAKGVAAGGSTLTLVKGALKIMAWTKAKTAIVAGAVVLFAAGTTTVTVKEIQQHEYKDYLWDVGKIDSRILDKAPHIVRIIPTKFPNRGGGWASSGDRILGIGNDANSLVQAAYGGGNTRTIFLTALTKKKYDYIANLPSGSKEALKNEIQRQFGVIGRFESVETNVLFLRIKQANAPGLRQTSARNNSSSSSSNFGEYQFVNEPMDSIAYFAENALEIPVIDQTGLKGKFDIDLKWDNQNNRKENFKQALADQLGLELVPGTAPVDMLFVERAK